MASEQRGRTPQQTVYSDRIAPSSPSPLADRNVNALSDEEFQHSSAKSHAHGTNSFDECCPTLSLNRAVRVMRDPTTFRKYADECRRLASVMPEHKDTLLQMAEAWVACAKAAEKKETEKKKSPAAR